MKACEFCGSSRATDTVRSPSGEEAKACSRCVWELLTKVDRMPADPVRGARIPMPPETRMRTIPVGQSGVITTTAIDHKRARRGT